MSEHERDDFDLWEPVAPDLQRVQTQDGGYIYCHYDLTGHASICYAPPITPVEKRGRPTRRAPDPAYTAGFLSCWTAYPHYEQRSKKQESFGRWKAQGLEAYWESVLLWIQAGRLSDDWKKDGGRLVPGFQVWINGRDFSDPPNRSSASQARSLPPMLRPGGNRLLEGA